MATPYGVITMWYSGSTTIPAGWSVCDGTSGTPDLRGLFIVGASSDIEVGTTSGCSTHTHTSGATGSVGTHTHGVSGGTGNASSTVTRSGNSGGFRKSGQHSHSFSLTSGASGGHSHTVGDSGGGSVLPPYYKLFYIMKV